MSPIRSGGILPPRNRVLSIEDFVATKSPEEPRGKPSGGFAAGSVKRCRCLGGSAGLPLEAEALGDQRSTVLSSLCNRCVFFATWASPFVTVAPDYKGAK